MTRLQLIDVGSQEKSKGERGKSLSNLIQSNQIQTSEMWIKKKHKNNRKDIHRKRCDASARVADKEGKQEEGRQCVLAAPKMEWERFYNMELKP